MLIKALILNSHKSLSQMFWDKVHVVNLYTVGIHTHILIYFIAFTVIDNGCLSGGGNCFQGDSGRIPLKMPTPADIPQTIKPMKEANASLTKEIPNFRPHFVALELSAFCFARIPCFP